MMLPSLLHSRRAQLQAVSLALVLISQLAFFGLMVRYADQVSDELNAKLAEAAGSEAKANLERQLGDMADTGTVLAAPDKTRYFLENWHMRDDMQAARIRNELLQAIDELALPPHLADTIYYIGRFEQQGTLVRRMSESGWSEETVPAFDELERSGLVDLLQRSAGIPAYFGKGELSAELQPPPSFPPALLDRVRTLAHELENKLVVAQVNPSGTLVIVTADPSALGEAVMGAAHAGVRAEIIGPDGQSIWRSSQPASRVPNAVRYRVEPYGFDIQVSEGIGVPLFGSRMLPLAYGVMAVLTVAVVAWWARRESLRLFGPIRRLGKVLSDRIDEPESEEDALLLPVAGRPAPGSRYPLTVRGRLFVLFLGSFLLPALAAAVFYTQLFLKDTELTFRQSTGKLADRLSVSAESELAHHMLFYRLIRADMRLALAQSAPGAVRFSLPDLLTGGLDSGSYVVVYDNKGTPVYSSVFSANLPIFAPLTMSERNGSIREPVMQRLVNVYGKPAPSIFAPADNGGNYYIRYVLAEEALTWRPDPWTHAFVAPEGAGESGRPASAVEVTVSRPLTERSWTLAVRRSLEEAEMLNKELLYRYLLTAVLIVLASLLLAAGLSRMITKPLERLQNGLKRLGGGHFGSLPVDGRRDELTELTEAYNRMVAQIDQLMKDNIETRTREQQLATQKARTELAMLQQQINPHFLYNTLEVINMQSIRAGQTDISTMVRALADLFRYSVKLDEETVALQTELAYVQNYVYIQQIRLGDKFEVRWEIASEAREMKVLKFLLQPLVENAIQYGSIGYNEHVVITVSASVRRERLVLGVTDTGAGMDGRRLAGLRSRLSGVRQDFEPEDSIPESAPRRSTGVGLTNVWKRLRLTYADDCSIAVDSVRFEGTSIVIDIPALDG